MKIKMVFHSNKCTKIRFETATVMNVNVCVYHLFVLIFMLQENYGILWCLARAYFCAIASCSLSLWTCCNEEISESAWLVRGTKSTHPYLRINETTLQFYQFAWKVCFQQSSQRPGTLRPQFHSGCSNTPHSVSVSPDAVRLQCTQYEGRFYFYEVRTSIFS